LEQTLFHLTPGFGKRRIGKQSRDGFLDKETRMSKKLILMRGLPFCGKSYTANEVLDEFQLVNGADGVILSTDEYFYTVIHPEKPKEYSFDLKLLGRAHQWNQRRATKYMMDQCPLIIIDNTNTVISEMRPYAEEGFLQGYDIKIQEPTSERWLEIHELLQDKDKNIKELLVWAKKLAEGSKETHSVPLSAFERMIKRWHNNVTVEELLLG
jgi:hypothetical protein